jgi:hypothetical protein
MAQWLVTATRIAHECRALTLVACESGVKQALRVLPAIAISHTIDPGSTDAGGLEDRAVVGLSTAARE